VNVQGIQKIAVQFIVFNLHALSSSGLNLSGNAVLFAVLMYAALAAAPRSIILTVGPRNVPSVMIAALIKRAYSLFAAHERATAGKYMGVSPHAHQSVGFKPLSFAHLYANSAVIVLRAQF